MLSSFFIGSTGPLLNDASLIVLKKIAFQTFISLIFCRYYISECGVFGIPLSVLIENDRKRTNNNDLRVPLVLSEIISFLEKNALENEGILRKSGAAARIKLLKQVRGQC